ncbi:MAG: SDR family NAD(P)-dependent oxidoreductase [Chlorobi bacterium]|nr:SDR family NAD(P)-dependent oxidoreductase [Chlorobiota bacterium]
MKNIALITGATSGIGEATMRLLAENHFDLIITGRRAERLEVLKKEITDTSDVHVLTRCFDIRNRDEVSSAISSIPSEWQHIDILINNAGLAAGFDTIQEGNIDDWEQMIDTNVKGLLYISRAVIPGMIERKKGHIINISSTAGKEVYAKGNVYCATKHAVDAINKAMRIDLLEHGIKVTSINPGMVETEFSVVRFKGNKEKADHVYSGLDPLRGNDIAEIILFTLTRPAHVNLNEIIITPAAQANSFYIYRKNQ